MLDLLNTLHDSALAGAIRGDNADDGSGWLFPWIETVHVLAVAVVFGSVLTVDLRLLGLSSRSTTVSGLAREVLPFTWAAFVVAAISGTLLFISKAPVYFGTVQFQVKFLLMALAGLNMLVFHFGPYRRVADWDLRLPPPPQARLAGLLSLALWVGVVFMGRWIGFVT
jgi:hypothetical protein